MAHRLRLTSRVGGDMRVRSGTFVDVVGLTVTLKRQNTDHFFCLRHRRNFGKQQHLNKNLQCKANVYQSYKPFGKGTCDGEAEHAATQDTENRPGPADEESGPQFIPTETIIFLSCIGHIKCSHKVTDLLLLCHKQWVKKL